MITSKSVSESNHSDLIGFIASTVESMRDQMATKSDLAQVATKSDLAQVATKSDVAHTAIRGDIEQVQIRLDSIQHDISSRFEQVEGEISRLRSAVYLLGKDRPEVLRLLGQISV